MRAGLLFFVLHRTAAGCHECTGDSTPFQGTTTRMRGLALKHRALLTALLIWLATAMPLYAQKADSILVTPARLQQLGIHRGMLLPSVLSHDGNVLLATEKQPDPKLKAQGKVWMLHVFHIDWNAHNVSMKTMYVPTTNFDQSALAPDSRHVLAICDAGTEFIAIDLKHMTARIIFKNRVGVAGFRSYPEVLWYQNKAFHVVGYYYDAKGFAHGDSIAAVDLDGTGVSAFKQVRDIHYQAKKTRSFCIGQWYSDNEAYFGGVEPSDKMMHLNAWIGNTPMPVDIALGYGGMAVGQDRVFYLARYTRTKYGAVVYDTSERKRWQIGDGKTIYAYPYMSDDGSTILVSHFNFQNHTMTVWYGREQDNFHLIPVPGLVNVRPGTIRFAKNGRVLVFYNDDGLRFIRIP